MGNYLNPGNEQFQKMIQSEIYVDKTGLIEHTNSVVNTLQEYICVSRPRRFGKSMTAYMLHGIFIPFTENWQEEKDLQILYFYQENNSQTNRRLLLN